MYFCISLSKYLHLQIYTFFTHNQIKSVNFVYTQCNLLIMNDKNLLEYIQLLGLTNEEFSNYLDISYDTLKTWLYRNKEVPKRKIDYVINKIKLHPNYTTKTLKDNTSNAKVLKEDEDFIWLETLKIPEKAALGAASNFFSESYMNGLEKGRVRVKKNHKGQYYEVQAVGDSMNDNTNKALLDKDWYLARDIAREHWINKLHLNDWNVFYFLHNEKGNLIKEVKSHNPETGEVLLHSWNPDKNLYPDFTINLKDCYIIGNVVKLISRDFNIFY